MLSCIHSTRQFIHLMFVVVLFVTNGAKPSLADEEPKSRPLKGEIRTNRVDQVPREVLVLPADHDPFSDDAAGTIPTAPPIRLAVPSGPSRPAVPRPAAASRPAFPSRPAIPSRPTPSTEYGIKPLSKTSNATAKVDANFKKGIDAEQRDDLATAIENFVIAVNNDPSNQEFVAALRRVELKFKGKCPKFHAYTSYFTGKRDARLLLNYGVRLYSLSCFQQAERLFNQAALLDPSNPNAHFNLGVIYEHNGQLAKALTKYQKSLSLFKLHGPDLPASVASVAENARKQTLQGKIAKVSRERRRFSGMEDPKNGRQLAQEAVDSVLRQMNGKPANLPKWPTLTVNQRTPPQRGVAPSRHVDTCDHCLIIRDVEMWPN